MNLFFTHWFVIRASFPKFFLKLNIYILSILFICHLNSYSQPFSAEQIYKKVSNAVVVINAYDSNDKLASQGSGVVLNDRGYVVTNYHVLSGNERLEILHGKEIVPYVDIIGIDVEKDILILKIKSKKFTTVKIGDSKSLQMGQRVYAIGSPMGFENTISEGIINGLRSYEELKRDFIQISANISPGSSGGAVVNDEGELIGISAITAKEGQNINIAIPIFNVLAVEIGSYKNNDKYKDFIWYDKGKNANERMDYHEAIKYFSQFIEKYPNYADAYINRGISNCKSGDYISAIQDFNKAIIFSPNAAGGYHNRGVAKNWLEDYRGAIQDYTKAIELNPSLASEYIVRGFAKFRLGDREGACLDWSKAGELGDPEAYDYISENCNK